MSGDDVCCSVVFGTLVGVFVFSVMWSELHLFGVWCHSYWVLIIFLTMLGILLYHFLSLFPVLLILANNSYAYSYLIINSINFKFTIIFKYMGK